MIHSYPGKVFSYDGHHQWYYVAARRRLPFVCILVVQYEAVWYQ